MCKWRTKRAARARKILALTFAFVLLQSCDNTSYTGTDKIDFVNRTVVEPLPTAAAAVDGIDRAEEVGVLVDGRLGPNGPHVNDAGFTAQAARLPIPNQSPSVGEPRRAYRLVGA